MIRAITILGILSFSAWAESGPVREASSPAIRGHTLPGFYNGYLYACDPGPSLSMGLQTRSSVTIFAPDGHMVSTFTIQGRGNGQVLVLAVGIDANGTSAIAWRDLPAAGIDIRDASGNLVRTIDTGRYIPAHLAFAGDHSLWAFGWQRGTAKLLNTDKLDYATVRKYSIEGKETGAYLPRSLFPPGLEPGMDDWQMRRITVTSDRVGLDAVSGENSNQREWVELDLSGNLRGRWKIVPSDEFPGVAFTSDNQAYVQRYGGENLSQAFRLDRATSMWEPVIAPNAELYGADGDKLVFARWTGDFIHLSWFPQPQISIAASTAGN